MINGYSNSATGCKEAGVYELTFKRVNDKANVTKPLISLSFKWF